MNGNPPAPSGAPRRFAPQPVGLEELPALARATVAVIGGAPWRLVGLYLVVFLPFQLLLGVPYLGRPLGSAFASVGFAGYFAAMDAVRLGRAPAFADLLRPWRMPSAKLALLAVAGVVPLLFVVLVWWADLGVAQLDTLLSGADQGLLGARQQVEFIVVFNAVGMPLLFLQPLSVLYTWTASRTLSANLIVCVANWRWALALTLVAIPIGIGLASLDPSSAADTLLSLIAEVAVDMVLSAFTLVLMRRSLR